MNRHIYQLQLIALISLLLFTNTLKASLKIEINKNNEHAQYSSNNHADDPDTVSGNNDKGSIFYPFNPFIAIPVSLGAGLVCGGILAKFYKEDATGLNSSPPAGSAELGAYYLGFAVGFVGSLSTFIILAYKKGKEEDARNRKSTLDFSIAIHQLPVRSSIYFLNYRYHF